jgi:hypothetical protein
VTSHAASSAQANCPPHPGAVPATKREVAAADSGPAAAAAQPWHDQAGHNVISPMLLVTARPPVMHHIRGLATDSAAASVPR